MPLLRRYIDNGQDCKEYFDPDVGFFTTKLSLNRVKNQRFVWLSKRIQRYKFRTGVEVGVGKAINFFNYLRVCPSLEMLVGVDPWVQQPDNEGPNSFTGKRWKHDRRSHHAIRTARREEFCGRCRIIRDFSHNVVEQFEDGQFDFVFIDGDHSYKTTKQDIELWTPKVRPGGLVSGHDFNWLSVRRAVEDSLPHFEYNSNMDNVWWYWRNNAESNEEHNGAEGP